METRIKNSESKNDLTSLSQKINENVNLEEPSVPQFKELFTKLTYPEVLLLKNLVNKELKKRKPN
jgi:hypothetical protein